MEMYIIDEKNESKRLFFTDNFKIDPTGSSSGIYYVNFYN
jgi:hypothetical protein